jgi:Flp pilus assembly protein TadG
MNIGRRRRQRGSAMIELAITLLGFMMLSTGTIEFGWAVYVYDTCVSTAQDAAHWASLRGSQSKSPATSDGVKTYVKSLATALDPSQLTVTTTWTPNNSPGSNVQVTVSYNFTPMSYLAIKQNMTLSGTAQLVINN